MGGDADLVQDLGHRQLVAVHTGGQMVLFLPHGHFDHAAGEDIFIKRLDEIVGKAFVQQLLNHFLLLSVFIDDRNFHAFLFQRFAASFRDLRTGIRHQKPNFFHRSFLQSVQFS